MQASRTLSCWAQQRVCSRQLFGLQRPRSNSMTLRTVLAFLPAILAACSGPLGIVQPPASYMPNVVSIAPRLVTAGQPSTHALANLSAQGFGAVVHLGPLNAAAALSQEAAIVSRQGLVYINIPIKSEIPTEPDYQLFASVMRSLSERKVLVHCQINVQASSMVFLYRVVAMGEDPRLAYESVLKVWSPDGPWLRFIRRVLSKHEVHFEPY